jgi:hypothetical protein
MSRNPAYKLMLLVLLWMTAALCSGQTAATAAITGRVVDPSAAVVPNATVVARNQATGIERSTVTTRDGLYNFPDLQTGIYTIAVKSQGFATSQIKDVKLEVGDRRDVNFNLKVGAASEIVEVTAALPLIETTKTEVSTTVTDADMARLPVTSGYAAGGGATAAGSSQINDFASLAVTAPGVRYDQTGNNNDLVGPGSFNNRGNLINVDGGNIIDQVVSTRDAVGASVDEIKEFQVLTNNYNAEYGQAGGLIINAITKSGTNSIHGDYHGYFRGRNLSASSYFYNQELVQEFCTTPGPCDISHTSALDGKGRAPFFKHENGFTLGGPIKKDKTFWFVSLEKLLQGRPLTLTPPSGNVTVDQPDDELLWSVKLDHSLTSKHQVSARFNVQRLTQDNLLVQIAQTSTPDSLTSLTNHDHTLNLALTSTLTPHLVNEARFFWHRYLTSLPTKSTLPGQQGPNFYHGAAFCCPQGGDQNRYQGLENLTYTRGNHTFKTGANISYFPYFSLFQQVHFGRYRFGTPETPESLPGSPANMPTAFDFGAGPGAVNAKDNIYGFYGQDSWKLRPNLTVNYGLRWDYEAGAFRGGYTKANVPGGCTQANGIIAACSEDLNNFQPRLGIAWSPGFKNGLLGKLFGGPDRSLIAVSAAEVTQLAYLNISLDSLIFDGVSVLTGAVTPSSSAPCDAAAVLGSFPNFPSPSLLGPCLPTGSFGRIRPTSNTLRNPETRMVNASIQRQLSNSLALNVQYVGAFGFGQFGETDTNSPPVLPDPANPGFFFLGPRPDPRFGPVRTQIGNRTSSYNGLIVDVTKRYARHFQVRGGYTYSHTISSTEDFYGPSEPADPRNIRAERTDAQLDVRHAANIGAVVDTENLAGGGWWRPIVNNWSFGSAIQLQAGRPYPISTGDIPFADSLFFGIGNETFQRPDVLPNGVLSTAGISGAFGTNYLVSPNGVAACRAAGQPVCPTANVPLAPASADPNGALDIFTGDVVDFQKYSGNLARNAGRTSPYYRTDLSVARSFHVPKRENIRVELRADFFNIFNHANFQLFNANDVLNVLTIPSLTTADPVTGATVPNPNFANCTTCINPMTGQYIGSAGQALRINDLKHGKVSKSLLDPKFGLIGDPSSTDIPRQIQLAIRVRF